MAAGDEVVLGYDGFTEQPIRRTTKPGEPVKTIRSFVGPQHLVDAKELELLLSYNVLNCQTQKGVPASIELETDEAPDGTDPDLRVIAEVVWSLDFEREMKELKSHGWFDVTDTCSPVLEDIDMAVKKGIASATDWDAFSALPHMNDYRDLRLRGVTSYISFVPTLRATLTMGKFTKLKVPKIDGTGGVTKWADIKLPFPAGAAMTPEKGGIEQPYLMNYYGVTNTPPGVTPNSWGNLFIDEWLRCPPKRSYTKSNKRYEMHFDWLGAYQWVGVLYNSGTGAPTP